MKNYYVFGINANNFIELDEYPENHREKYIEELKDIHMGNLAEIFWIDVIIGIWNILQNLTIY